VLYDASVSSASSAAGRLIRSVVSDADVAGDVKGNPVTVREFPEGRGILQI
jgi:hypothetical protein